ncbi:MAG: 23S rRNA (cytidine(2498)-2'-O)-methyltransferase RlmM [Gammaproteobacteria bacterium]|nr:23S rRNA (cytidine(2498)-2'-O)-methyltransferase RlmM [Gammaproteobacteria bacterium]
MDGLLCYCRAGFEPELAAELSERAAHAGLSGYARTERNSGYVVFAGESTALSRALPYNALIFARQKLVLISELRWLAGNDAGRRDRIGPILDALAGLGLGIPRLKLHAQAPSRSALKLEEALLTLLDPGQRAQLLQPGMRAADLGAAPGGWTWVLARHGLHVTAIDNGPLRQHVLDTGLVEHLRADGFNWQPQQALDWMVCDMVEQPRRVAARMATWFREGWCRHMIFNLKLPMTRRRDETRLCLDLLVEQARRPLAIHARQLYHDREEITVFATPASPR